ncbi:MAG: class I SAM-dependent methyltransferase [Bacteroidetes bacterium]|nr:class I SAM-dependent methyltransferase [Bacteroidota bacterium]
MQYDPIKRILGKAFNRTPRLRVLFYRMLNLLLLRTWHIRRELKKWVREHPGIASVLDAGSGFGQYSWYLGSINRNWQVTGVDLKEEQTSDCNAFFKRIGFTHVSFKTADLTTLSDVSMYDLIISVDVMEHILEDTLVFQRFHQALKPGGMVLISTPSDKGGSGVHEHGRSSFIEEHVRDGYGMEDIQQKLMNAGFGKTEAYYSYGKPGHLSWLLTMKYPIRMLGITKLFFLILPFYYLIVFPFSLILNFCDVSIHHNTGTGLIVKAWK